MGLLNKLQFWKRDEEFPSYDAPPDLPETHDMTHDVLQADPLRDPMQEASPDPFTQRFSTPQYPQASPFPGTAASRSPPQQYAQPQYEEPVHPRDVELILAKLDAIKSEMDALHQRVRRIEQSLEGQPSQKAKYW